MAQQKWNEIKDMKTKKNWVGIGMNVMLVGGSNGGGCLLGCSSREICTSLKPQKHESLKAVQVENMQDENAETNREVLWGVGGNDKGCAWNLRTTLYSPPHLTSPT